MNKVVTIISAGLSAALFIGASYTRFTPPLNTASARGVNVNLNSISNVSDKFSILKEFNLTSRFQWLNVQWLNDCDDNNNNTLDEIQFGLVLQDLPPEQEVVITTFEENGETHQESQTSNLCGVVSFNDVTPDQFEDNVFARISTDENYDDFLGEIVSVSEGGWEWERAPISTQWTCGDEDCSYWEAVRDPRYGVAIGYAVIP